MYTKLSYAIQPLNMIKICHLRNALLYVDIPEQRFTQTQAKEWIPD
ncbi:MAG: hypothetical protein AAFW89_00345 [Bacteroidota bacterium]